jgi:hypothetical protein
MSQGMRALARPHGPPGDDGARALIMCEHHDASHVARLFGVSRPTVVRHSIHGTWPHFTPPTGGNAAPWFCRHDIDVILARLSHEDGGRDG